MVDERLLCKTSGIILGMSSTNEGRRYNVTSIFIGWAHTRHGAPAQTVHDKEASRVYAKCIFLI